jgi:hypothetical protein
VLSDGRGYRIDDCQAHVLTHLSGMVVSGRCGCGGAHEKFGVGLSGVSSMEAPAPGVS